jgi:BirA family transcriptional regulator, biotin operon repressor / biotin---[acetyl-CoA-carboxylase] ligase
MKARILNILRQDGDVVSGEVMSSECGISRVSVWKHIKKLKELGYDITSTSNGYRLDGEPDALYPWEFGDRADRIHFFSELSSTMDTARDLARKGCPDFTVVIADRQTKGRGRLSRTWISDSGGLYFSVILRPLIPPVLSFRVNFAASLALARMLREKYHVDAAVKWPNDILIGDAKLSGMLSELEAEADRVSFINLGIGINVNNDPAPKEQRAVSLKKVLGKTVPRRAVLAAFLDEFEKQMADIAHENVIDEWKIYSGTLNRPVKIVTLHDTFQGVAEDVDETGTLILRQGDGTVKKVVYGDCFHRLPTDRE